MIFTETREGRRRRRARSGNARAARPPLSGWDYSITSGWFQGSGYIRDPLIRPLLEDGGYGDPMPHPGHFLVVSLQAPVSQRGDEADIAVRVLLAGTDGGTVAGQLEEGISASLEVNCQTYDDITLRRYHDSDINNARWLDVSVNVTESSEVVKSGRVAMEAMPSRLLEPNEMPRLKVGDYLQHPRLGQCEVVKVIDDDRVSIRMSTGKVAQLHLGLLSLSRGRRSQGRMVYDVQIRRRNRSGSMASRAQCIEALESLSPTRLAESWDNVGLLLEPTERPIHRALVTIDLTEAVCDEALAAEVDLVIAYHPPIFSGLKKITQAAPLTRSLLRLCEAGVTLWSPHTALDAVVVGLNDWLAAGVGAASASARSSRSQTSPKAPASVGWCVCGNPAICRPS